MDKPSDSKSMKKKRQGNWQAVWKRLRKNKLAMVAMVFLLLLLLIALFAGVFFDVNAAIDTNLMLKNRPVGTEGHVLGTDPFGRDILVRLAFGLRITLILGFASAIFSSIVGAILGASTGYFGGMFDTVMMRLFEVVSSVPGILITLVVVAGFGGGMWQMLVAITIGQVAGFTRLIRSAALAVAGLEYVEVSKAMGANDFHIIVTHVIPNVMGTILVQAAIAVSGNILLGTMLGFLGLGVPAPAPEWGSMLLDGLQYMRYYPHLVLIPGIAITLTVTAANILGDGVRDAFDPRLKGEKA